MNEMNASMHHYFSLRGALLSYQQLPWQLEEAQAASLQQAVAKEITLTRRALETAANDCLFPATADVSEGVDNFIRQLAQHGSAPAILQQAGLDSAQLHEAISNELLVAAVLERVTGDITPSDEQLRTLYEQNRDRFVVPERRELFHILITVNDDYAENSQARALERINKVAQELEVEGARFGELAQRYSECPSALEAGRLGIVARGQLYPGLDDSLFAMGQGEISPVLESPLGYHLLRCGTIEPARQMGWDEVKEPLAARISERQRRRRLQEWLHGV